MSASKGLHTKILYECFVSPTDKHVHKCIVFCVPLRLQQQASVISNTLNCLRFPTSRHFPCHFVFQYL
jgi:hypothetical protein